MFAQITSEPIYTRADSLRGSLSPLRSCYDVTYYDLNLRVIPAEQTIQGYNVIHYRTTAPFRTLQVDLFENMPISRITHRNQELTFEREADAVFITFPQEQPAGQLDSIRIAYAGKPMVAKNPPWDGGFTWAKDKTGKDWIGVSCEGIGASLWWPNKDHLSDEPDSMKISAEVPTGLMCVANGNLRQATQLSDGYTRYDWLVSYPINNYNVSLNIADYAHFSDTYTAQDGEKLALDYYVLPYNIDKAKKQFEQVKPMLACYEKLFGKYPFWQDGYALVETPYLGMEHQSAVAYGNNYLPGYAGEDLSGTGVGLKFDYLIIHESGHEYWGNSVSARDHAELWIHESFCTYTEALYVECTQGYDNAVRYVNGQRRAIQNREPIVAPLGVNADGSGDMYFKGANMLHTLRNVMNDDTRWFAILNGLAQQFERKTTNTQEIIAYINGQAGQDYTYLFDQYLRYPSIPVFEYRLTRQKNKLTLAYRWVADVKDFRMPLQVDFGSGKDEVINPTTQWQTIVRKGDAGKFKVAEEKFYVNVRNVADKKTNP